MQGRPSYPSDSRGSSGTVDIFARAVGGTERLWEVDDLVIAVDGTASTSLSGLSVGTYDFLLKGYIHLAVIEESKTLVAGGNSVDFENLLVGDIAGTPDPDSSWNWGNNKDNWVNSIDNGTLFDNWTTDTQSCDGVGETYLDCKVTDFNLDGKVNSIDHGRIFNNWGKSGAGESDE